MRSWLKFCAFLACFSLPFSVNANTIWIFKNGTAPYYSTDAGVTWSQNTTAGVNVKQWSAYSWTTNRFFATDGTLRTLSGSSYVNTASLTESWYNDADTRNGYTLLSGIDRYIGMAVRSPTWIVNGGNWSGVVGAAFSTPKIDKNGVYFWQYQRTSEGIWWRYLDKSTTQYPTSLSYFTNTTTISGGDLSPSTCYRDSEISVNGEWVYFYKNSNSTTGSCGSSDTPDKRGIWRTKKDGSTTEQVFSSGSIVGGADICQSEDGATVLVASQWLDRLWLSRVGNANAWALNDWTLTGPTRDWVACGVSPDGKDLYALASNGEIWGSIRNSAWTEIAKAGTITGASIRSHEMYVTGNAPPLPPAGVPEYSGSGSFAFGGSGTLTGAGSGTLTFWTLPEVWTGATCSTMFDDAGNFAYTGAQSSFSLGAVVFDDPSAILGDPWTCALLTESADPCSTAYGALSFVVDGLGSGIEYVFQSLLQPLFDTFGYLGTPEPGSHCFLGSAIQIVGKADTAPEGETGYDYIILLISASWLLYGIIRKS